MDRNDFDFIVDDYVQHGMDRTRAVDVALFRVRAAQRRDASPGPINRTPDRCYDCGSEPGTRCWLGCAFVRMALEDGLGMFFAPAYGPDRLPA